MYKIKEKKSMLFQRLYFVIFSYLFIKILNISLNHEFEVKHLVIPWLRPVYNSVARYSLTILLT